jgi:large subunit ribosomal protein L33
MAKKGARQPFLLKCSECGNINYITEKNTRETPDKMEFRKWCKFDRKVTVHKEIKVPAPKK